MPNTEEIKNLDMPVSNIQQTAINLKANSTSISNIDNTSDANKPVSTAQAIAIASAGMLQLIASATSISGASLATTALTFAAGKALSTHTPTHVIFKYVSGTTGINVTTIDAGSTVMSTGTLVTLSSTINNLVMPCTGFVKNSGNISAIVTTASLAASSFAVYVYGISKP